MKRIGILGHGFQDWGGGIDFLRVVADSIAVGAPGARQVVLSPSAGPRLAARRMAGAARRSLKRWLGRPDVATPSLEGTRHLEAFAAALEPPAEFLAIDIGLPALRRAARRRELEVLLPALHPLPADYEVPWVGYIYDFQHQHLPELFSEQERALRSRQFATTLAQARAVIVNSRAVAADVARFHPGSPARVFALPFSAAPRRDWFTPPPGEPVARRHGIDKPYFIICNQFWTHKDHRTAFEAFARHASRDARCDLVCTGSTTDYRAPGHFQSLLGILEAAGVRDRVHILGMIPKADQVALLNGAQALVQPTRFEGGPGGGSVYDAVSLGVPCIVSDIAVNREIDEPGVSFFATGDATSLAARLDQAAAASRPPPDVESLMAAGRRRRQACHAVLEAAVAHAMGSR